MKAQQNLIVIDDMKDRSPEWKDYNVIAAEDYLTKPEYSAAGFKIVNLCRIDRNLSTGYYISLLAEARGHRAMPTARTLQNLTSKRIYADVLEELDATVQKSLARIVQEDFALSVYFGQNLAERHSHLAQQLFNLFPCPLFKVQFCYSDHGWEIQSIKPLGLSQVPQSHRFKVVEAIDAFLSRRWTAERGRSNTGFDIAILHNPEEKQAPSDKRALRNFIRAGEALGCNVELITRTDYPRLLEFDALFIRETTALDNHTYRFATKAYREGMAVIDDPDSIRRCCNKIYLHELLRKNRLPVPRTEMLYAKNADQVAASLGFPMVIKVPDSAFSLGVFKIDSYDDLKRQMQKLFKSSDFLIAQEFLFTDFDWRVGVLEGQPLFVCRYYMSEEHWQIYNHSKDAKSKTGNFDTIPVSEAPRKVLQTALAAAKLIGDGLYGVDLKQRGDNVYIIEVNDNPNIDAGIEDQVAGTEVYQRVMKSLLQRIEKTKQPALTAAER
jgi:glutathione synthase/RimK-type ligase-like ATP-grasp enzyme